MRREGEIKDKLAWAERMAEEKKEEGRRSRWYEGWVSALEWALTTDELTEKLGKRFETCPVKGVDCNEGPFYGLMLLAHMKEAHPDKYDAVTTDREEA